MESRWRFLHRDMTELWGRIWEAWAGNGKTGASEAGARKGAAPGKNRRAENRERDAERKRVAKHVNYVPRKAAIVHKPPVPKTDTGGWGENPKAGGRSIVKELGKMAP